MNKLKLLPKWFRIIGLTLVIPIVIAFIANPDIVFGDVEMPFSNKPKGLFVAKVPIFFDSNYSEVTDKQEFEIVRFKDKDLSNEILLTLMLIGVYFISFSQIKNEDEFSERLRLEAFSQAIIINSILLLLMNWLFYDGLFLILMATQLFSFLLIFSLVFAIKIRKQRRNLAHEE
ncbi:MAG: hypothetical protein ACJAV5_000458 [Vicingaceae bacterium]|jgi:hypothetical protein|tara:strand:+ start:4162 stop:4683 length:522 start_codon:yes stop_codon:yes gene_type:complete